MRIKNIYVGNIINTNQNKFVVKKESNGIEANRILEDYNNEYYMDLEDKTMYRSNAVRQNNVVDKASLVPLSDYYYKIGIQKPNSHKNKQIVYEKVKKIKKVWGEL